MKRFPMKSYLVFIAGNILLWIGLLGWYTGKPKAIVSKMPTFTVKGFKITAYCPCKICNKQWTGYLATGHRIIEMMKVYDICAVDPKVIPLGSAIEWNETIYIALDVGSAIKGKHIDILLSTHKKALQFGIEYNQEIKVYKGINILTDKF